MTPPRRKTAFLVGGYLAAGLSGFASHWLVPVAVKDAPAAPLGIAAPAAPETLLEKRLLAVELQQSDMGRKIDSLVTGMIQVRCRLNIENSCPPETK